MREENIYLRKRVAELEAVIEDLRAQIEELRRSGKRQAAPFSKGEPKENPKSPGGARFPTGSETAQSRLGAMR